jgi:hypothetical protein
MHFFTGGTSFQANSVFPKGTQDDPVKSRLSLRGAKRRGNPRQFVEAVPR